MQIERVGVVGCGLMGSGIAEVCARKGLDVLVVESDESTAKAGRTRIESSLATAVDRGKLDPAARESALAALTFADDIGAMSDRHLVVEAVSESESVKTSVFRTLDEVVEDGNAILASNTSSIPIMKLATVTRRPEHVIGIHFFNPVPVLPLVELVSSLMTSSETTKRAAGFAETFLGKHVIHSQDRAGFIVNALLVPYLLSAIRMLESGFATAEDIDAGMMHGCAHPMGPLALADLIGLDTTVAVAESLYDEFKEPLYSPPPMLCRMVDAGLLGRKSGADFTCISVDVDAYQPPLASMLRTLGVVGLDDILELGPFASLERDDVADVLEGFGRFASDVLAPTDRLGDRLGNHFEPVDGRVTTPKGIREAFQRWVADGWSGLAAPAVHGGGGLPGLVGVAAEEMFASANLALSLNPMLTQGSIHLIDAWGTEEQKQAYLPQLVTGEWTGTMNLTEPDAGSDVGAVRARAVPRADGYWEITGTKIFITWGEHDLAENIVHLVLARTPDAPAGTRGISLFVVPRQLLDHHGNPGERNHVRCTSLEEKLGIHASPTCVLEFDAAVGELIGPECGGMSAMFTMMNAARLSVGIEGLAVSERSFQQALDYASERRQGRAPGGSAGEPSPIIDHPDVRRMLLSMASTIEAMRLLIYTTAAAADLARHHPDSDTRRHASARADLLTPLSKAWCTDEGVRMSSLAIQVHGGAGYIEDTGIAQRYRDSRIAPIYEGTNGIQAIDLVARKLRRDDGHAMTVLIGELEQEISELNASTDTFGATEHASGALRALRSATTYLVEAANDEDWLTGATPYLELAALGVCGGLYAQTINRVGSRGECHETESISGRFRFFATERIARSTGLLASINSGASLLTPAYLR